MAAGIIIIIVIVIAAGAAAVVVVVSKALRLQTAYTPSSRCKFITVL